MVDQNETDTARQFDTDPIHDKRRFSSTRPMKKAAHSGDDVIVWLADAYENQRARQVTEWEQMGYQADRRAT